MKKVVNFLKEVRKEMSKVHFPTKKVMAKYSIAVIGFILLFSVYFLFLDVIIVFLKQLVN